MLGWTLTYQRLVPNDIILSSIFAQAYEVMEEIERPTSVDLIRVDIIKIRTR